MNKLQIHLFRDDRLMRSAKVKRVTFEGSR
jgi:hypothetical protein